MRKQTNNFCFLFFSLVFCFLFVYTVSSTEFSIVKHEYIVFFSSYITLESQNSVLNNIIGNHKSSWTVLPRNNKATEFPSDFVVLKITDVSNENTLLQQLKDNPMIKNIYPQKKYSRSPQSFVHMDDFFPLQTLQTCNNSQNLNYSANCSTNTLYRKEGRQTGTIFLQDEFTDFSRRKLHSSPQVTHLLNADFFWDKGINGKGVRVAVFDTGLSYDHPHFVHIKERSDWTDEGTLEDYVGHGTFVAGVIASNDGFCPGFAPESDLYIFRVFTNSQASYTSWFLDAFNYAIHCKIDVLNLSIGGPDWMDQPFVEKVWELSANNIIVVSAIGNDGPHFGTLNNPADMMDVIGVGGIDFSDNLAHFSSRGMTTWELPHGYGRVKPDIVGYGKSVTGSRFYEGCRTMSGTSVASPVITGAVTLLISSIPEKNRQNIINPASVKQVLVETSELIPSSEIFEQGFGKINIVAAYEALSFYSPRASIIPPALDLTECPYMWPYCAQGLYYSAMPVVFNTTILNGMGITGIIEHPTWEAGIHGDFLEIAFTYSDILWPWTGYLAMHIRVNEKAKSFRGEAEGIIRVKVHSPPQIGETSERISEIEVPLKVSIIPTPPTSKRILWDQFHSLNYPLGFFPNDVLWDHSAPFDWNGDHLHTNFRGLFRRLLELGFHVEILGEPLTCFDASNYGTLILPDPEDEFAMEEKEKLYGDITDGLSILILADWYNSDIIEKISFYDENTQKTWTPYTGGSNLPALNDLLERYGMEFGNHVLSGDFKLRGNSIRYGSGTSIIQFPKDGELVYATLDNQGTRFLGAKLQVVEAAVLGMYSTATEYNPFGGKIALFGDSSCFDDTFSGGPSCTWLIRDLLYYTNSLQDAPLEKYTRILSEPLQVTDKNIIPKWIIEQEESFTRLDEENLHCNLNLFEKPVNLYEDPVEILWQPLMYLNTINPLPPQRETDVTQFLQDSIEDYFITYLIICSCVILIMAYAIRRKKKQKSSNSYTSIDAAKAFV